MNAASMPLDPIVIPRLGPVLDRGVINQMALCHLDRLLECWFPEGGVYGRKFVAMAPPRADHATGALRVDLATGRWADGAAEEGRGAISLVAYLFGLTQAEAAARLAVFLRLAPRAVRL